MPGTLRKRETLIVGGGIGGLAAAIALGRSDRTVTVLERSSFTEESGAGIQLGPNATRVLRSLGVLQAIEPLAFRPEALLIFDALSGRKLATVPLGPAIEERHGAPYLTLHRADLHTGLLETCKTLGTVTLRPGFNFVSADDVGDTIVARDGNGDEIAGGLLIGADGLWSKLRTIVAPNAHPSFVGATAYRTMLPREALPSVFAAPIVGLWLGPDAHLVHYPVRGGKELNIVAVTKGGDEAQGWNAPADPSILLSRFTFWSKDSKSLLEMATGFRRWSLYRVPRLRHWSQGRIALLGDAAHPALPYLAQGAALAIEDAMTLRECLDRSSDPTEAFRDYQRLRQNRTARVQRRSLRLGHYYHFKGPARLVRNALLTRRDPDALLASLGWLYRA
jgi:2-polyprenyl-6-methoxyphenol hydroxylase-like FAD-dependent oxidoreductase